MCIDEWSFSHAQFFVTQKTVAHQAPLSIEFSRQDYCSGLPFPFPGDLPYPGIEPVSPAVAGEFSTNEPQGSPKMSAAAKLLQLCLTLYDPIDGSPPGSSVHGIF